SCSCHSSLLCVCIRSCAFVFFFFSSRRRHTRSTRDWSSDVCSSDLSTAGDCPVPTDNRPLSSVAGAEGGGFLQQKVLDATPTMRSEERRVGKECRCRWGRWQ